MTESGGIPARRGPPAVARAKLDEVGIAVVCQLIEDDRTYRDIAAKLGISKDALMDWLRADRDRQDQARESLRLSSATCDEKAEAVLLALPADATPGQVAQARELAQHYRWRAKARNPREYGDKSQVEVSGDVSVSGMSRAERAAQIAALLAKLGGAQRIELEGVALPSPGN